MLSYEPDETIAHALDPRAKLLFQLAFAVAAIAHSSPVALVALTGLAIAVLASAGVPVGRVLYGYRYPLGILGVSVLVSAATLGPPWIDAEDGLRTALSAYGVGLVFLVSAAYVRSTPVRHSRAAVQRLVPGRPGKLLGIGVSLVFRFVPVLRDDVGRIREATAIRLGTERSVRDRAARLSALGLDRAFTRADRLSVALQARCLAWNPTLPPLSLSRRDLPVLALALVLPLSTVL